MGGREEGRKEKSLHCTTLLVGRKMLNDDGRHWESFVESEERERDRRGKEYYSVGE
jgi:hypothetical protein